MKTVLTVRFTSGREERFEMDFWGGTGAQGRLQAFAEKPNLLLQTGEEVLIIPASAIECISIKVPDEDGRFNLSGVRSATRIK
jgi:hypothetical protein